MSERLNNRKNNELRNIKITKDYTKHALGSVLVEFGDTKVIVTASVEESKPRWMDKTDPRGWVTAEYSLLPSATHTRCQRERNKISGRTQEIQRLIGRSLRSCVNLEKLGDRTVTIDADVIQADGGTRCASICGGFVAMNLALQTAKELGSSKVLPEHLVLGILKSQKGVAYEIFEQLNVKEDELINSIVKPIEKQMPETLVILKLAKEEARRIGKRVVGTEMLLLGIIAQAAGIGARVLTKLEITLQDARKIIESQLGYGNDYFESEIIFTKRAKAVLERAWELAKKENKERISSEDLLMAIIADPSALAMKVLEQLGVDAVEIKYGILKEIE